MTSASPDQPSGRPQLNIPELAEGQRPQRHSTRTKARKRAIDILFEAELRGGDPIVTLAERTADADPPVREFTSELVRGVVEHRPELDEVITAHLADGWTLARLPRVDRAALRIAAFELAHTDVPADVAVSEAVSLVGDLSTDESPAFVNAVLAAIGRSSSH
ncbi:transcription antitermination factor NusB [Propionibacteriaceae bacterium Y1685]|uniref:transcription antitermination factor NusB n=1 Tax=Microlunatus sp. Y1700 TaxID=3418487 RepID=UPI003B7E184D